MSFFVLAQFVGAFALLLEVVRFQCKSSKTFFYFEPVISILYFIQFSLLGASGAFLVSVLCIVRAFCGVLLPEKIIRYTITLFFIPAFIIIAFSQMDKMIDTLPAIAVLFSTLTFLTRENRKIVVRLYILNSIAWLFYTISFGAYVHALNAGITLISLLIGILRHEKGFTFPSFTIAIKPAQAPS